MSPVASEGIRDPIQIVEHDLLLEFEGTLPRTHLARLASEEVQVFDGAKIPDFIPIFAWRRARARAKALLAHGDVLDAV